MTSEEHGNGVTWPSSKHLTRCWRIRGWSRVTVRGFLLSHNEYAFAMAKSPQSLFPTWCWTPTAPHASNLSGLRIIASCRCRSGDWYDLAGGLSYTLTTPSKHQRLEPHTQCCPLMLKIWMKLLDEELYFPYIDSSYGCCKPFCFGNWFFSNICAPLMSVAFSHVSGCCSTFIWSSVRRFLSRGRNDSGTSGTAEIYRL